MWARIAMGLILAVGLFLLVAMATASVSVRLPDEASGPTIDLTWPVRVFGLICALIAYAAAVRAIRRFWRKPLPK